MSKVKALIIDDNKNNVLVLEQLLTLENVETIKISVGNSLLDEISVQEQISIVFLDLEMPNITGYDVLAYIRSLPAFKQTKVIAYTVHLNDAEVFLNEGFDGFLGKPIGAEDFPRILSQILNGEKIFYMP